MIPAYFAQHVTDVEFRRRLFGYRPDDVHGHLAAVRGWLSLAGVEEPLRERIAEIEGDAERRRRESEAEAARILDEARSEAEQIRASARHDADTILVEARLEAERERRGSSRIGRPVGNGRALTLFQRRARS